MSSKVVLCLLLAYFSVFAAAQPIDVDYDVDYTSDYDEDLEDIDGAEISPLDNEFVVDGTVESSPVCNVTYLNYTYYYPGYPCTPTPTPTPSPTPYPTNGTHPTHRPYPTPTHRPHPGPHPEQPYPGYPIYILPPRRRPESTRICKQLPGTGLLCSPAIQIHDN